MSLSARQWLCKVTTDSTGMTVWLCSTRPWIWTLTCEFIQVSSVMKLYSSFDFSQPLGIEKNSQPAKSNRWLLVCSLPLPDLDGCGTSVRSSGKRSASKLILQVGETQGRGDPRVSRGNRWSLRLPRSNQIHSLPVVSSSTFE